MNSAAGAAFITSAAFTKDPAKPISRLKPAEMARSSGIVFIGTIAGRGLNFVGQVVLSNLLGLKEFGTFIYCNAILIFLSNVCLGGFSQTTVRYLALARANNRPAEIRALLRLALAVMGVLTLITSLSVFGFRHPLAERWLSKPEIAPFWGWIALGVPTLVIMVWLGFALRGFRDVSAEAIIRNLVQPLAFLLGVTVIASFVQLTTLWAIVALLASIFVTALIGMMRLRRHLPAVTATDRPGWRRVEVLKSAFSVWFARFSDLALNQADRLMIGAMASLSQVGIYHAAFRIADFQTVAMGSFVPMFSTAIAEAHATGDRHAIVYYYRLVVRWSLLVTIPICLICCLFAAPILRLFGPEFVSGAPVLVIIAVASLIDAGVGPAGQFLQMMGKEKVEMIYSAAAAVLAIVLNAILIPRHGAMGAAIGTGNAIVFLNVARLLALRKIVGVFPYTLLSLKLIAVSALAVVLAWLAKSGGMWLEGIILLTVYVTGAMLFCLDADDRAMLRRIKDKLVYG